MSKNILKNLQAFFGKTIKNATQIRLQSLNKISLIILILVDIFVLFNVFSGLESVTNIIQNPDQAHFCYSSWAKYKNRNLNNSETESKIDLLDELVRYPTQSYSEGGVLFSQPSPYCNKYAQLSEVLRQDTRLRSLLDKNSQYQIQIQDLNFKEEKFNSQYNSTLLENIAGQSRENSINLSDSASTKQDLLENKTQIDQINQQIKSSKAEILSLDSVQNFLKYIESDSNFENIKTIYQNYTWQYRIFSFLAQIFFLIPLFLLTWLLNNLALRKNKEILFLLTSNLLIVFFIPVVFKIFEFLQFGALAEFIFRVIVPILAELAFLGSYLLILIIPLFAYFLIRIFHKVGFNSQNQISKRVQEQRCQNCSFRLNNHEMYCPSCGKNQYNMCQNCNKPKYLHLSFCQHCGKKEESLLKL